MNQVFSGRTGKGDERNRETRERNGRKRDPQGSKLRGCGGLLWEWGRCTSELVYLCASPGHLESQIQTLRVSLQPTVSWVCLRDFQGIILDKD